MNSIVSTVYYLRAFIQIRSNESRVVLYNSLKPNTHRRRRRNSTVELSRVGVGGVYWERMCHTKVYRPYRHIYKFTGKECNICFKHYKTRSSQSYDTKTMFCDCDAFWLRINTIVTRACTEPTIHNIATVCCNRKALQHRGRHSSKHLAIIIYPFTIVYLSTVGKKTQFSWLTRVGTDLFSVSLPFTVF